MWMDLLLLAVGVALLAYSGDRLIDCAVAVAQRARLTPAVIGLTVVSAGTSAPELFVSATAALNGSPEIAIANVIGSNVANIALVLGACATVAAVPISRGILRLEYPFMVLASWITLLLCRDGLLDRLEGSFFIASMVAFTGYAVWLARQQVGQQEAQALAEPVAGHPHLSQRPTFLVVAGLVLALVGLGIGARLLVQGAVGIAQAVGVSQRVIGLTVVAIGTSLPELVASIAAAVRKQHEMAVTNIVGSNIFNLLLILGITGVLHPIPVAHRLIVPDMWVMLGVALLLLPPILRSARLSRRSGLCLLAVYATYLIAVAGSG